MTIDLNLGDTQRILAECRAQGCTREQTAYILATAKWETAHTMKPVRETLADSDMQAVARLDHAWKKGQLPWVSAPYWRDGWFGRGYVQLTHRDNYAKAEERIGVDLTGSPSAALRPDVAARVLVRGMMEGWFTGRALPQYVANGLAHFREARRVVNGTDKAEQIAAIAEEYLAALKDSPEPVRPVARPEPPQSGTIAAVLKWIARLLSQIFKGGKP